ncbi:MAG TPA: hypothetical protein VFV87_10045, partial [Pirellulaceae bacterium]|nr:hypothetical protein [Pirellulaceae bacterium]
MLSPQEFARLLQDKLIEAGENRPLEFRADLFGFIPRGGDLGSIFPLDNYYRQYLAAASDGERQRVARQFTSDWLRHAKAGAPVAPGAGGAPAAFAPSPLASGHGAPVVVPNPLAGGPLPRPSGTPPRPSVGCGVRAVMAIIGVVGLAFVCFCGAPLAMLGMAKNRPGNFGPGNGPRFGPDWEFHAPADVQVTEFVGGRGGGPRFYVDPQRRPVIGLAYSTDNWGGQQVIGSLAPVYDAHDVPENDFRRETHVVRAKEGYVVGGLEVDAG